MDGLPSADELKALTETGGLPQVVLTCLIGLAFALAILKTARKLFGESRLLGIEIRDAWRSPEARHHLEDRRRFAEHLASQLEQLNRQEDWQDHRYSELEAEVETEGKRHIPGLLGRLFRRREGLRRERSLSVALRRSAESIILVQGEAGSGKSVALRHVALELARRAARSHSLRAPLPIYLNLKELQASAEHHEALDLERLLESTLARGATRDTDAYVDAHLRADRTDGRVVYILDSFDEIPMILSATEVDSVVKYSALAIEQFLGQFRHTRGLVASRDFRGPKSLEWPIFNILSLSERRKRQFVFTSRLGRTRGRILLGQLVGADPDVRKMADNPLYLHLLCEYFEESADLPSNVHDAFDRYLVTRLNRDADRLASRFGVDVEQCRNFAEQAAFVMTRGDIGLSPTRKALFEEMAGFDSDRITESQTYRLCDALVYSKIAKSTSDPLEPVASATFTFSHRRFQEYFATCRLLQDKALVPPEILVGDGKWRESAVVLLQTQQVLDLETILGCARRLLDGELRRTATARERSEVDSAADGSPAFVWESETLHALRLIAQGFSRRRSDLPLDIIERATALISGAFQHGRPFERLTAIELSSLVDAECQTDLLRESLSGRSTWLRDPAYSQLGQLKTVPAELEPAVYRQLVALSAGGALRRTWLEVLTRLRRLDSHRRYVLTARVLVSLPFLQFIVAYLATEYLTSETIADRFGIRPMGSVTVGLGALLGFLIVRRSSFICMSDSQSVSAGALRRTAGAVPGGSISRVGALLDFYMCMVLVVFPATLLCAGVVHDAFQQGDFRSAVEGVSAFWLLSFSLSALFLARVAPPRSWWGWLLSPAALTYWLVIAASGKVSKGLHWATSPDNRKRAAFGLVVIAVGIAIVVIAVVATDWLIEHAIVPMLVFYALLIGGSLVGYAAQARRVRDNMRWLKRLEKERQQVGVGDLLRFLDRRAVTGEMVRRYLLHVRRNRLLTDGDGAVDFLEDLVVASEGSAGSDTFPEGVVREDDSGLSGSYRSLPFMYWLARSEQLRVRALLRQIDTSGAIDEAVRLVAASRNQGLGLVEAANIGSDPG